MSTVNGQPGGGDAVGGLLQAVWRYKWLIAAVVLLGALLGYGWAARQPTLYSGVSRVVMASRCPPPPLCHPLRNQGQLLRSPVVLQRAVKLSGNRISAETLGQRLQVDLAWDTDVVTIRVVDSTAMGAAQLANAVPTAYRQLVAQESRKVVEQLGRVMSELETTLARTEAELADRPNDGRLRKQRDALAQQLSGVRRRLGETGTAGSNLDLLERAAVPEQPIQPRLRRPMGIGMLLGLLVSAVLVWWLTRRQGPTASAPEQGPEMPSPA
jgi:uncharacterized protein involved in exopolysaccharide biosynthesis